MTEPLLRDKGRAESTPLGDRETPRVAIVDPDDIRRICQYFAGQRGEQLILPVPGDTRDAEDFAGRQFECDAVEFDAMRVVRHEIEIADDVARVAELFRTV